MTAEALTAQRQHELMAIVDSLTAELKRAPIDRFHRGRPDPTSHSERGIPGSVLGNVVSWLRREKNPARFIKFIERLEELDPMTAQNGKNPKAHHLALKRILAPWLQDHAHLQGPEVLYVLAWAQRLLPPSAEEK